MENIENLLVYVRPEKKFIGEHDVLAKVQIDNAISLGQKDNIVLITNFDYEYNGVKSIVVGDENYCAARPRSIKTSIIPYLIKQNIIEKDKIYWNHDLDAYQLENIEDSELGLDGFDAGFTTYGWKDRWCLGSDFIKSGAKDIFEWLRDSIFSNLEDETALGNITKRNTHNINTRIKKMNITYQIGMRNIKYNYEIADKPIKVLHFHPSKPGLLEQFIPLMSNRLIEIFKHHGIQ